MNRVGYFVHNVLRKEFRLDLHKLCSSRASCSTSELEKPIENEAKEPVPLPPVDISRLDLRIGKILTAEKHPNADKLILQKVDFGEESPRQILTGLVGLYDTEKLRGQKHIFLLNIPSAKIRGELSQGMMLIAEHKEPREPRFVEPLYPELDCPPGSTIFCPGTGKPDEKLASKAHLWTWILTDFNADSDGCVTYKNVRLQAKLPLENVATADSDVIGKQSNNFIRLRTLKNSVNIA